ncbi:MAG: hypothetical protein Q8P83_00665 [bacterium]|nr:hypothetical protein [bacterium]
MFFDNERLLLPKGRQLTAKKNLSMKDKNEVPHRALLRRVGNFFINFFKTMNQEGFSNTLVIVLAVVLMAGVVGYFMFFQKQETAPTTTSSLTSNNSQNTQPTGTSVSGTPSLSADKKSIVADGKVLLSIDSDTIFNWFKTESQLCDGYNLTNTPDRKMFCENKTSFKNQTRFASIVVSPDKMKIGFTIENDTLSPDKVAGIFLSSANKVDLLTNFYLGNEFISFSPSGTNFVYQGGCFEGMCGLFIKNSETLANKASLNNPEFADARGQNAIFVRWISDNKVEYKLGTELKQESF